MASRVLIYFSVAVALILIIYLFIYSKLARFEMAAYDAVAQRRYDLAQNADEVNIAVVFREGECALWNGASKAADQINQHERLYIRKADTKPTMRQRSSTVPTDTASNHCLAEDVEPADQNTGKPVTIKLHPFPVTPANENATARLIARSPEFVAVIGHSSSDTAAFASVSYESTQLIFMAPTATDSLLTQHQDFRHIFRTAAEDRSLAAALANALGSMFTAANERRPSVGILYAQTAHGLRAIDQFAEQIASVGVEIAFQSAYTTGIELPVVTSTDCVCPNPTWPSFGWAQARLGDARQATLGFFAGDAATKSYQRRQKAIRDLVAQNQRAFPNIDAVVLIDERAPSALEILDYSQRLVWANKPVLGAIGLDARELLEPHLRKEHKEGKQGDKFNEEIVPIIDKESSGVYLASTFSQPDLLDPKLVKAFGAHKLEFGEVQAYEAVRVLKQAMARADSLAPLDVGAVLRSGRRFRGVTLTKKDGAPVEFCFSQQGEILGRPTYVKRIYAK